MLTVTLTVGVHLLGYFLPLHLADIDSHGDTVLLLLPLFETKICAHETQWDNYEL